MLHQPQQIPAQPEARHLDACQDYRFFRRVDASGDIRHAPLQRLRIGAAKESPQGGRRRAACGASQIRRQFKVYRQVMPDAVHQHPVDLLGGRFPIQQHGRVNGDPSENLQLPVIVGNQMVHHRSGFTPDGRRRATDEHQRHLLGESPCHGIQNAEPADSVRYYRRAHAVEAGITVSGVTGVQLVAGADPGDGTGYHLIKEIEDIIARDAKKMVDPEFLQTLQQISRNRTRGRHEAFPLFVDFSSHFMSRLERGRPPESGLFRVPWPVRFRRQAPEERFSGSGGRSFVHSLNSIRRMLRPSSRR